MASRTTAEPWATLGLDGPPEDEKAIKRAYAAKLKVTRPDDDPEGFAKLREAYDHARNGWQWMRAEHEQAQKAEQIDPLTANAADEDNQSDESDGEDYYDDWDDGWREDDVSTWYSHLDEQPRTWAQRVAELVNNPPKPWGNAWNIETWEELLADEALDSIDAYQNLEQIVRSNVMNALNYWEESQRDLPTVRFEKGFTPELLALMNERFDWVNARSINSWEHAQFEFLQKALRKAGVDVPRPGHHPQLAKVPRKKLAGRIQADRLRAKQQDWSPFLRQLDRLWTWPGLLVGFFIILAIAYDGTPPNQLPKSLMAFFILAPFIGFTMVMGRRIAFFIQRNFTATRPWLTQLRANTIAAVCTLPVVLLTLNSLVLMWTGGETQSAGFQPTVKIEAAPGVPIPDGYTINHDGTLQSSSAQPLALISNKIVRPFQSLMGGEQGRSGWLENRFGPSWEGEQRFECGYMTDETVINFGPEAEPNLSVGAPFCRLYQPLAVSLSVVDEKCIQYTPGFILGNCLYRMKLPTLVFTFTENQVALDVTGRHPHYNGIDISPDGSRKQTVPGPLFISLGLGQSQLLLNQGHHRETIAVLPEEAAKLLSQGALKLGLQTSDGQTVFRNSSSSNYPSITQTKHLMATKKISFSPDDVWIEPITDGPEMVTVLRALFPEQFVGERPTADELRTALSRLNHTFHADLLESYQLSPLSFGSYNEQERNKNAERIIGWLNLETDHLDEAPYDLRQDFTAQSAALMQQEFNRAWKYKELFKQLSN